ncbi:MAG: PEP-CTERM sorting domain-containing protein [Kiritimatiellae bacterium]|nr:PEP-CTERM sorting domain-containing protein [Kiritimatiellia bacterium]
MNKILAAVGMVLSLAVSSHAALYVSYGDSTGFVMPDGTTPIINGGTGSNALFQLIFTASGINSAAFVGGATSGDNVILAERTFSEADAGNPYLGTAFEIYGPDTYQAGYVFVRIFQGGTDVGNTAVGDWYIDGQILATINNPGPPTIPDLVQVGPVGGGTGFSGTYRLNQQVVPEPTTLALAALGVLGVVARRFRRS